MRTSEYRSDAHYRRDAIAIAYLPLRRHRSPVRDFTQNNRSKSLNTQNKSYMMRIIRKAGGRFK
ncbi:MAG: hypothetical protein SW833_19570 [Cyanobacteriota bacterium]|nr:hypothetical protein [Cyanobacteriota bacterium]